MGGRSAEEGEVREERGSLGVQETRIVLSLAWLVFFLGRQRSFRKIAGSVVTP